MGVDTKASLKGKIEAEQILLFIREHFDENAKMDVKCENCGNIKDLSFAMESYGLSKKWQITSGYIDFAYKGENRALHYFYDNVNSWENLKCHSENGLEDMVKSEKTQISLGLNDLAQEVIFKIVSHFGGWYDEDDCDEFDYISVPKGYSGEIKPIRRVTMDEVYKQFGEIVIITDR